MKVLVTYYSQTGTTQRMAEIIVDALKQESMEVVLSEISQLTPEDLLKYDGILIGSPTYYGSISYQVKKLLDESVAHHGELDGKVGGAFASSANIAGGNETTLISIIEAMMIHGMIIQGDPQGDHYGPVAVNTIDERAHRNCIRFAKRFAGLLKKVQ